MSKPQLIEKIRQSCIKANPDLLKLGIGCKVSVGTQGIYSAGTILTVNYAGNYLIDFGFTGATKTYRRNQINKIIGREPQLSDVILAVTKDWYKDYKGHWVFFENQQSNLLCLVANWDLTKPLSDQSLECLSFVANLLGGK